MNYILDRIVLTTHYHICWCIMTDIHTASRKKKKKQQQYGYTYGYTEPMLSARLEVGMMTRVRPGLHR